MFGTVAPEGDGDRVEESLDQDGGGWPKVIRVQTPRSPTFMPQDPQFSPQPVRKMFTKHPRQPTLLTRIPAGQCPLPTPVNDDRHSGGSSGSTSLPKSSLPGVARLS